jgi:hypothetical protein
LPYPNFCQQKTLRPLISPSLIHHPPTSRSQRLHHGFPHGFRARGLPVSAIWRCMQLQLFRCTGADLIRPHSLDRPFYYLLASNEPDTDSDKYVYSPAIIMPFTLLTVAALKPPVISVLRSTVPVPSLWSPRPQRSQRRGQQGNQNQAHHGLRALVLSCTRQRLLSRPRPRSRRGLRTLLQAQPRF